MSSEHMTHTVCLSMGNQEQIEWNEHALLSRSTVAHHQKQLQTAHLFLGCFYLYFLCVMSCNCASSYLHILELLATEKPFRLGFPTTEKLIGHFNWSYLANSLCHNYLPPPNPHWLWSPQMCRESWEKNKSHIKLTFEVDFVENNSGPTGKKMSWNYSYNSY